MLRRTTDRCLTHLAIHLTRIAIRTALRGLFSAPGGGRAAKPAPECAGKRFRRTKANGQRDIQNRQARLGCKRMAATSTRRRRR